MLDRVGSNKKFRKKFLRKIDTILKALKGINFGRNSQEEVEINGTI